MMLAARTRPGAVPKIKRTGPVLNRRLAGGAGGRAGMFGEPIRRNASFSRNSVRWLASLVAGSPFAAPDERQFTLPLPPSGMPIPSRHFFLAVSSILLPTVLFRLNGRREWIILPLNPADVSGPKEPNNWDASSGEVINTGRTTKSVKLETYGRPVGKGTLFRRHGAKDEAGCVERPDMSGTGGSTDAMAIRGGLLNIAGDEPGR